MKKLGLITSLIIMISFHNLVYAQEIVTGSSKGLWKGYYGIFTAVVPADLDLYRELLPWPLQIPAEPLVGFFVLDYFSTESLLPTYLEGSIGLRCVYNGTEGWHTLTMPVTELIPCLGGRLIGFNKYVADEITLTESEDGWIGAVVHKGELNLTLEFTKEEAEIPDILDFSLLENPSFQFAPAGLGLILCKTAFKSTEQPSYKRETGIVKITISPDEPWYGLVPENSENTAVFQTFEGRYTLSTEFLAIVCN